MSPSVSVIARRAAAGAAAAAALVGAAALPTSAADHDHGRSFGEHVVISDVQYRFPGRDNRSNLVLNREWVQLANTDRRAVNLDGWALSTENGRIYTFRHYRLDGRSAVRVHTGIGRDSGNDLYQDRRRESWTTAAAPPPCATTADGSSTPSPGVTTTATTAAATAGATTTATTAGTTVTATAGVRATTAVGTATTAEPHPSARR